MRGDGGAGEGAEWTAENKSGEPSICILAGTPGFLARAMVELRN